MIRQGQEPESPPANQPGTLESAPGLPSSPGLSSRPTGPAARPRSVAGADTSRDQNPIRRHPSHPAKQSCILHRPQTEARPLLAQTDGATGANLQPKQTAPVGAAPTEAPGAEPLLKGSQVLGLDATQGSTNRPGWRVPAECPLGHHFRRGGGTVWVGGRLLLRDAPWEDPQGL